MTSSVDSTLAALSDPTRRAVVGMLSKSPQRPSDLAEALSVSRPALSRHLRVLRRAGLVREQVQTDDARNRLYELCQSPLTELRTWLQDVEAYWEEQLSAFKHHAEWQASRRRQ